MRVRTYGVPGFFYEADPESSTRDIGAISFTSNLIRPLARQMIAAAGAGPAIPAWDPPGRLSVDVAAKEA